MSSERDAAQGPAGNDPSRDAALAVGRRAERAAAAALDRVEDLALWLQQQALTAEPGAERFAELGPALVRLRRRAVPVPGRVGRAAAGSTYFALRLGLETYRTAVRLLDETARLFEDEREQP